MGRISCLYSVKTEDLQRVENMQFWDPRKNDFRSPFKIVSVLCNGLYGKRI